MPHALLSGMLQLFKRKPSGPSGNSLLLGPFVGAVTHCTAKLWVHYPRLPGDEPLNVVFQVYEGSFSSPAIATREASLSADNLGCGVVEFDGLQADKKYLYQVCNSQGHPLSFSGLSPEDLFFQTYPAEERLDRFDFLLMSCHDPGQTSEDGVDGFRVWSIIDQVRENNPVRFALLIGDQIYGDHVQETALKARTEKERLKLYLDTYRKAWSHAAYRKALCSLPAYLMWDDHDITDGWGSRSDSFVDANSAEVRPEWQALFNSAKKAFENMQASRNPEPISREKGAGFDFGFTLGRVGFAVADLRSHRNVRKRQIWSPVQKRALKDWVLKQRGNLDALFFISPVVITHGWPQAEKVIRKLSPFVTTVTEFLSGIPVLRRLRWVQRLIKRNIEDFAGFRDDLEDAWASDPNNQDAEELLDFLFELQNPTDGSRPLPVFVLSGDIHTAGYSMVCSSRPEHKERPVIEHVCSSPVASKPMGWYVEAAYQQTVTAVPIGTTGSYTGQVSHHHCQRNLASLSMRRFGENELQLKIKFYIEGKPQPEILVSDLARVTHREWIDWDRFRSREQAESQDKSQHAPRKAA